MGPIIITIVEICNGVSVLTTKDFGVQERLQYISMLLVVTYVGVVYGEPYYFLVTLILLTCALLSRNIFCILLALLCVGWHILSDVVVFTNLNKVMLAQSLLTPIVALNAIAMLVSMRRVKKKK